MDKIYFVECIIAAAIRYWLLMSDMNPSIANHIEISSPVNSWKRVVEGVTLFHEGINPYSGDLFHETPLVLLFFSWMLKRFSSKCITIFFISCDIITAYILHVIAKLYVERMLKSQKENEQTYAKNVDETLITNEDKSSVPLYVFTVYLFNPYIVLNCVGRTTTVIHNLFLSMVFYSIASGSILYVVALPICIFQSIYAAVLIVPICLGVASRSRSKVIAFLMAFGFQVVTLIVTAIVSAHIVGNYDYIKNTFGFVLNVPDLKPNIGLFWYFFTEMFEHFRPLFIVSFQVNATLLYLFGLSIRLRDDTVLLAFTLTALTAIFKSYPCIGDVGFYMSLLPMWKQLYQFMQQGFIVACFFVGCTAFAPTMWHLWIYSGSANANFYFGVTLAFATAQIFLITDLLFAYTKREFTLKNGFPDRDGEKRRLMLD